MQRYEIMGDSNDMMRSPGGGWVRFDDYVRFAIDMNQEIDRWRGICDVAQKDLVELREKARALVRQIMIGTFLDEYGHDVKMNSAYHDLRGSFVDHELKVAK